MNQIQGMNFGLHRFISCREFGEKDITMKDRNDKIMEERKGRQPLDHPYLDPSFLATPHAAQILLHISPPTPPSHPLVTLRLKAEMLRKGRQAWCW